MQSFLVENIVIQRDAGTITLRQGTVTFAPPVLGRVTLGVFVGEGEFVLAPPPSMERDYLKSVAGGEAVKESFRQAVFCFTDGTYDEIRADGKAVALEARAAEVLKDFRERVRRREEEPRSFVEAMVTSEMMDNIEAEMLADLYNTKRPGFFSVYMFGNKLKDLRFQIKPLGPLPELPSPEEVALINVDPGGDLEGIWYLAHLSEEIASGGTGAHQDRWVVDAESYQIDTTVTKNDRLSATTRFRFRAVGDGDRVIKFGLLPRLRVTKVSDPNGRDVSFIQEDRKADGTFYVIMPEPMAKDRTYELVIAYEGDKVIRKEGGGNFSVGARTSWYPSVNAFSDRAKFDLTFKVPKQYTLVGVGNPVKEWKEKDFAASQWISEVPLAVAGFNYGQFDKKSLVDEPTKYAIEGYATREVPSYLRGDELPEPGSLSGSGRFGAMSPKRLTEHAMVKAQNSIRLFELWYGKTPFGRIAITQQPQFYSGQSWPTLVYLPVSAFLDSTQRWQLAGLSNKLTEFIQEVIPHEVAHQWWGHVVGWESYHDQWISEGFSDFSAGLYLQHVEPGSYLRFWENAKKAILEKNQWGRCANDAGPIWMGLRLRTYKNPGAYHRLVYSKGGYILHMLRTLMYDAKAGDRPFIAMMRDFVQSHFNQNASTESFKAVVEKHMTPAMDLEGNQKMDWFFRQWVYGTEIPRYDFKYTVTPEDGKWILKASLTQSEVSDNFKMAVPVYADFDAKMIRLGLLKMTGNTTFDNITVALPQQPKRVVINAFHDVLER